jgi:hypothetical protein
MRSSSWLAVVLAVLVLAAIIVSGLSAPTP